jgi:hypothetical protein
LGACTPPLNLPAPGRRQTLYVVFSDFAEPCVFSKQSPPPTLCPPPLVAHGRGPLLPKLRGHFAEFLQHRSLTRLGMLYQSTGVGFGYGLSRRRCFPEGLPPPPQSIKGRPPSAFVTSGRRGNINPLPIGYGSRPRLRGPANPARNDLAQEPLDFRRAGFSPAGRYSCQHSHFRCLHGGSRPRFSGLRNAPLPRALARPPAASVRGLSPGTFSARAGCSTSELLRFL